MSSYSEPTIPCLEVVISHPQGGEDFFSIDDPKAWGDTNSCVEYICLHRPGKGSKFAIRNIDSGRLVSFMIPKRFVRRV